MSCFSCVMILLVEHARGSHVSSGCVARRALGCLPPPMGQPSRCPELSSPRLGKAQNATEPLLGLPTPKPPGRDWPLPLPWQTGTVGQRATLWDACTIDSLPCCPSCCPQNHSLPRTPELLAQGPVSLLSPEEHPGALVTAPTALPSR